MRWEVTADIILQNNYKHLAEIGVSRGDHPRETLRILNSLKYKIIQYHLVDLQPPERKKFAVKVGSTRVNIFLFQKKELENFPHYLTGSEETSKLFSEETLDYIFIDADTTSKEALEKDIKLWLPKLRKRGTIGGRYLLNDEDDEQPTGYIRNLVNEIFGKENICLNLLQEKCSGKDDYYWWYRKEPNDLQKGISRETSRIRT